MSFEIITPGRFIEPSDQVGMQLGAEGWFTLEARSPSGTRRSVRFRDFPNLITNLGLEAFGSVSTSSVYSSFVVGVGTRAPSVQDTELVEQVGPELGFSSDTATVSGAPDYYAARTFDATYAIGALGNVNLTEIGVTGTGGLFSRALIVDSNGNPTAFPIAADEQLRISYELRIYPPLVDVQQNVNISGARDVTIRAIGVTTTTFWSPARSGTENFTPNSVAQQVIYTGGLGSITSTSPQGSAISGSNSGSFTLNPYNAGSLKRSLRRSWAASHAVSNELRTHMLRMACCSFQVEFDPPLAKTNEQTMFIDYEVSWGRR